MVAVAKKTTKKTKAQKKPTRRQRIEQDAPYLKSLDRFLDRVYEISDDRGWSWCDLAEQAKLHRNTSNRIGNRHIRDPHLYTVFRLAEAVGLEREFLALRLKNEQPKNRLKSGFSFEDMFGVPR